MIVTLGREGRGEGVVISNKMVEGTRLQLSTSSLPRPSVPAVLLGKEGTLEDTTVVEKTELFLIGCR